MPGGYHIHLSLSDEPPGARSATPAYATCFARPGVEVRSNEPVIGLGDRGCIIGHLFTQGSPSRRIERLDPPALARLEESGGRSLLRDYWGGYVMLWTDAGGRVTVLRDPSGIMPCYIRRNLTGLTLAADITDLANRGPRAVDFDEIARLLASADAPGRRTCVAGVEELVAGECLVVADGSAFIESWWSPWDHVTMRHHDPADAAAELRATLIDCIGAWANCFGSLCLGVSGGLDSSIVAAAAAPRAPHLSCLTLVGPDADGDERRYARALVEALGLRLHERYLDLADIDIARAPALHHPWPNGFHFKQAVEAIHSRLEHTETVSAFFTGNGGDGIFCSMHSAVPFLDRFLAEGPRPALAATLRHLCRLTGADAMTVLRHAWGKYRRDGGFHRLRHDFTGLAAGVAERIAQSGALHPWLAAPDDALPGKTSHIAFLMRSHRSHELYPRASRPPHIAPLLSQPIVELCLSIPTWMWIEGGIDRAIARAAFADRLPPAILRRVHKGGPGGFSLSIYRRDRAELHRFLRDGHLAAAGLLDPALLDEAEDPSRRGTERIQRILALGAAESWARWWSNPAC